VQAAAQRVQHRKHLGKPNGGLAPLQLDEKANPNARRGSQLILP